MAGPRMAHHYGFGPGLFRIDFGSKFDILLRSGDYFHKFGHRTLAGIEAEYEMVGDGIFSVEHVDQRDFFDLCHCRNQSHVASGMVL